LNGKAEPIKSPNLMRTPRVCGGQVSLLQVQPPAK
jgi:hypothetical protein